MKQQSTTSQGHLAINFLLVRHGETYDNIKEVISGHQGTKLTQKGVQQAETLGHYFLKKNNKFDKIYVSDLERTKSTFATMCESFPNLSKFTVQYTEQVRQKSGGELEGQPKITTFLKSQEEGVPFRQYRPKAGESFQDLNKRVWKFLTSVLTENLNSLGNQKNQKTERNILIVTHGGVIRQFGNIMNQINGKDLEHQQSVNNCSINQFLVELKQPMYDQSKQITKNILTMRLPSKQSSSSV